MPLLTVIIPTYGREQVLVDTITAVHDMAPDGVEIIVIDQTPLHTPAVERALAAKEAAGVIQLIKRSEPSICAAMNVGLKLARSEIVLFLDDDVIPESGLIEAHVRAHEDPGIGLVAGRVVQPWHAGTDVAADPKFHFASTKPSLVNHFMGGNFSVGRDFAISLGGFDENFVRVAYNFEAEFAYRLMKASKKIIFFEPRACVHHLKVSTGGTREFGEHLTTWRPDHSVGAYYYTLRTWSGTGSLKALLWRPLCAVATRHHLTRPWWIPLTLIGEIRGLMWALLLLHKGPAFIGPSLAAADGGR